MVTITFQIIFRVEMHINDFFYFLKIIFDINISKQSKIYKNILNFNKNIFFKNIIYIIFPNSF